MDRYNVNLRSLLESSCSQDRKDSLLLPTATTKSCPGWFGHSVQTLNSPHCEYVNQHETDTFDPQHTLDDYSIFDLLPTEPLSTFTELITQKDLDEIVPVDDLTGTDATRANLQQTTQKPPHSPATQSGICQRRRAAQKSPHSTATASHSSLCPTTTTTPPVQQQVHTKTAGHQLTGSFDFGKPSTARTRAYRKNYSLAYGRAFRAEMAISHDEDKAKRAAKAAGKAAGKAASKAEKKRIKESSADHQFLTVSSREDRIRAYIKTYHNAYTKAYKRAFLAEISLSDNLDKAYEAARAAGKAASKDMREQILTSADFKFSKCQPLPNFCDNSKNLYTIPMEPISP